MIDLSSGDTPFIDPYGDTTWWRCWMPRKKITLGGIEEDIFWLWDGGLNRWKQKEICFILLEHILVSFPVATFHSYKLPAWHKCPFKERFNSPKQIDLDITSWEPIYHILTSWHFWVDDASLYLIRPPHRQDVRSSCAGVFRSMSCTLGLGLGWCRGQFGSHKIHGTGMFTCIYH